MAEPARRMSSRADWGFVHQNSRDGLRVNVSAGDNVGERLMSVGACYYGAICSEALEWLERVEIDQTRIDDRTHRIFKQHAAAATDYPQSSHWPTADFYG